eukprot:TRINITY_DN8956_c0_g1_i1.p1 TRINITY_DN8956_c0_g1~~TRINITY_DN8956_c0_g1_i1.p1  ORF type:complete len:762 (-),score=95.92 TRINITY_DN8956_c0_g1_i1:32-2317(-)
MAMPIATDAASLFDELDDDGDGMLTREELFGLVDRLPEPMLRVLHDRVTTQAAASVALTDFAAEENLSASFRSDSLSRQRNIAMQQPLSAPSQPQLGRVETVGFEGSMGQPSLPFPNQPQISLAVKPEDDGVVACHLAEKVQLEENTCETQGHFHTESAIDGALLRDQAPREESTFKMQEDLFTHRGIDGELAGDRHALFDRIDRKHDGVITREEFCSAVSQQHFHVEQTVSDAEQAKLEENACEALGGVHTDADIDCAPLCGRPPREENPCEMPEDLFTLRGIDGEFVGDRCALFDRVDRNHDGVITREEFRRAVSQHQLRLDDTLLRSLSFDEGSVHGGNEFQATKVPNIGFGSPGGGFGVPNPSFSAPGIGFGTPSGGPWASGIGFGGQGNRVGRTRDCGSIGDGGIGCCPSIGLSDEAVVACSCCINGCSSVFSGLFKILSFRWSCDTRSLSWNLLDCPGSWQGAVRPCCGSGNVTVMYECFSQCCIDIRCGGLFGFWDWFGDGCCDDSMKYRTSSFYPWLFSLLCIAIFASPIIEVVNLAGNMQVQFWICSRLTVVLILPLLYSVTHVVHMMRASAHRKLVIVSLVGSCIFLLVLCDWVLLIAKHKANLLLSSDCTTFEAKHNLNQQWLNAELFYRECMNATMRETGASGSVAYGLYRIQDCYNYRILVGNNPDLPYLGALEQNYECGGWCTRNEPLWTFKTVKDSCSVTVAYELIHTVQSSMMEVVSYSTIVLVCVSLALLKVSPMLRSHGISWK